MALILQVADKKESSSCKDALAQARVNLVRAQQGFGVLSVALGSQALSLMATLMEDMAFEVSDGPSSERDERVEPATFDLFHPFSATQRIALILNSVPFVQLLFNVAIISYRKACNLKGIMNRTKREGSRISGGEDSTSAAPPPPVRQSSNMDEIEEDSFSEDEDFHDSFSNNAAANEDDDEDEPLLGKWFEDTLFPPEEKKKEATSAKEDANDEEKEVDEGEDTSIDATGPLHVVPDRGEPGGFISLASRTLSFADAHLLGSQAAYVQAYFRAGLTEQQMTVLAAITRDLDLESASSSASSQDCDPSLGALYAEFSSTLADFTHNLLAHNVLTPKLTGSLLLQLGVHPSRSLDQDWPLRVYPRTLAVLTQVKKCTYLQVSVI